MLVSSSEKYAWVLVGITSVASIFGSLTIYVDVLWNAMSKRHFSILHSDVFLGSALSLSCGTLLVTSLNALLPKSVSYILQANPDMSEKTANKYMLFLSIGGALLCYVLNEIVLRFAANSLAACPHELDTLSRQRKTIVHGSHEHHPLLDEGVHDHGAVRCETHHNDLEHNAGDGHSHVVHSHASHSHAPHNHLQEQEHKSSNLLALSLQTTLGICIHRLPEGLMLFATSRADSELGLSMVLALSIHSFSEGFSVAAPLYGAIGSRLRVVLFTILLVCGPQILGAYIGSKLFTTDTLPDESMFGFGLCMAATAGFMLVVCLQMIGAAFRYISQDAAIIGVLAGVFISFTSRTL